MIGGAQRELINIYSSDMAERELLSAVVAADRQTLAGRNHEDRPVAAGKLAVVCGDHGAQENDA